MVWLGAAVWTGSERFTALSAAWCAVLMITAWTNRTNWERISVVVRSGSGIRLRVGMFQLKLIFRVRRINAEVTWG